VSPPGARSRARLLARHGSFDRAAGTGPALVCPLVLAQAAEIEALPAEQFLTDPTKLANGLRALHRAFGNDVIVTAAADDLAASALAASVSAAGAAGAAGDPAASALAAAGDPAAGAAGAARLAAASALAAGAAGAAGDLAWIATDAGPPRVAAAVEATRRLAATAEDAALAAALCGPAWLAAQLGRSPADHPSDHPGYHPADRSADHWALETCGAVLLALAKAFLEAGANLLLVVEPGPVPPASADGWRSAVTPLVNVARFRQAAAAVVLADPADAALAPRGALVCLPPSAAGPGQGIALGTDPAAWPAPPPGRPLLTTLGPVQGGFAECRAAVNMLVAATAET
jgi:hypothetical protein